ncbi:ribonuclease P protein component [Allohahella marinimesophila]|uniref:Ribonuclease P protein component n=1 Tax=Allohahella marinimesophila TaxID=1054972 RepID=A0ABP7PC19_9GAMM
MNESFPRIARLLAKRDFSTVFEDNHFKRNAPQVLMLCHRPAEPGQAAGSRLGVIVAKKQVKRAHERNRLKRLAREQFRRLRSELPEADIVLLFRHPAQFCSNAELSDILRKHLLGLQRKYQAVEPVSSAQQLEQQ